MPRRRASSGRTQSRAMGYARRRTQGRVTGRARSHTQSKAKQPRSNKYTRRNSPPVTAAGRRGDVVKGNDGQMYESVADKNGVCRWRKYKAKVRLHGGHKDDVQAARAASSSASSSAPSSAPFSAKFSTQSKKKYFKYVPYREIENGSLVFKSRRVETDRKDEEGALEYEEEYGEDE